MLMAEAVCERDVQRIAPFGAILYGYRHGSDISALSPTWLKSVLDEHKLLILRDFNIFSQDAYVTWARRWGELLGWGNEEVLDLKIQRRPLSSLFSHERVPFRWDGAHSTLEPRFLMFQCLQAPGIGRGGETLFCNTERVLIDAGRLERARWEKLYVSYYSSQPDHHWAEITVPLVDRHPTTDAPRLRFSEPYRAGVHEVNPVSISISGATDQIQEKLIEDLIPHLYARANCYTHSWRIGDLVIADNAALLHGRKGFNVFSKRLLRHLRVL